VKRLKPTTECKFSQADMKLSTDQSVYLSNSSFWCNFVFLSNGKTDDDEWIDLPDTDRRSPDRD
jgi:hypothetical protein